MNETIETMNAIKLQNRDIRWYRDKYLIIIFVLCFLVGMSLVWQWPPPHDDLIRSARFFGVAAFCLIASPQRRFILLGSLVIIFFRGMFGFFVQHSLAAFLVSAVCGAVIYYLTREKRLSWLLTPYEVNDYSYSEMVIDCAVLGSLLWIYVMFIR